MDEIDEVCLCDRRKHVAEEKARDLGSKGSSMGIDILDESGLRKSIEGFGLISNCAGPSYVLGTRVLDLPSL